MKPQLPQQYLDQHEMTRLMRQLEVSQSQLDAIKFRPSKGFAFDFWSFSFPSDIPEGAIHLVKAYCALKWLVLEDPPYSRDKEDAYRLVQDATNASAIESAVKARAAQRVNGKRGADARRKYSVSDHEEWKRIASEEAIARHYSKRRRATLVAQRLNLPSAAIETIRRCLD